MAAVPIVGVGCLAGVPSTLPAIWSCLRRIRRYNKSGSDSKQTALARAALWVAWRTLNKAVLVWFDTGIASPWDGNGGRADSRRH